MSLRGPLPFSTINGQILPLLLTYRARMRIYVRAYCVCALKRRDVGSLTLASNLRYIPQRMNPWFRVTGCTLFKHDHIMSTMSMLLMIKITQKRVALFIERIWVNDLSFYKYFHALPKWKYYTRGSFVKFKIYWIFIHILFIHKYVYI